MCQNGPIIKHHSFQWITNSNVWPKIVERGEYESAIIFSKFSVEKLSVKEAYWREGTTDYKVWSTVIESEEFESIMSFQKSFSIVFATIEKFYTKTV